MLLLSSLNWEEKGTTKRRKQKRKVKKSSTQKDKSNTSIRGVHSLSSMAKYILVTKIISSWMLVIHSSERIK